MSDKPTLSLCMIARNEEAHLPRCLESVQGLVDDIVLVDTGSTDQTQRVARSFDARVFQFIWQDDFSMARNFSIDHAAGDWILILDADESIALRDHDTIRALIRRDDFDVATAFQRHYLKSGTVVGWQPGPGGYDEGKPYPGFVDIESRRLFRNRPWIRYRNAVHEDLYSLDSGHVLAIVRGGWIVHHYGKADEQTRIRNKGEAYLRIGLRKVEEHPEDPLAHYELGAQYREINSPAESIPCFEKALALAPGFRDAALQIAISYIQLRQFDEAQNALAVAVRTLPKLGAEIALAEGNLQQMRGDPGAAEIAFRRAISIRPDMAAASVNLAYSLRNQGRLGDALECLDQAIVRCPGHADLIALRAQIRSNAGDDEGALEDIESLHMQAGARRMRARLLARQRRFLEALECLQEIDEAPDSEIYSLRGAVALGLGNIEEAVIQLGLSLDMNPTFEAAMNLSTVLEARGDLQGALSAAAKALGLSPDEPAAWAHFARLCGNTLCRRAKAPTGGSLPIFFYQQHGAPSGLSDLSGTASPGAEDSIDHLAAGLARHGYRTVIFNDCDSPGMRNGVEYTRSETMPARCLTDRPGMVVGDGFCPMLGRVRFAPLQFFRARDVNDAWFSDIFSDPKAHAEIDFYILRNSEQAVTLQNRHGVPDWQIIQPSNSFPDKAKSHDTAAEWTALCRAALMVESPLIERIAMHLTAGRTSLAASMLGREACPENLPNEIWDGLKAIAAWKAGSAGAPSASTLQQVAICIPAFRRSGLLGQGCA